MKKFALLFLCSLLLVGCGSKNSDNTVHKEITLISEAEMESQLKNSGWDVQNTSAASFHLWEQMNPTVLLLAENTEGQVLLIGEFSDSQQADLAYTSVIPFTDDDVENQDTETYFQSFIPLSDQSGYWLFRQAGKYVLGAWMSSESQVQEFETLFSSFETSSTQSS